MQATWLEIEHGCTSASYRVQYVVFEHDGLDALTLKNLILHPFGPRKKNLNAKILHASKKYHDRSQTNAKRALRKAKKIVEQYSFRHLIDLVKEAAQ